MLDFVTGYLAVASFCASGAALLPDQTCTDKTPPTHLEMRIVTADHCDLPDCWKHVNNLLEVRRNGDLILSVPADVLTDKERELVFQLFLPAAGTPDLPNFPLLGEHG